MVSDFALGVCDSSRRLKFSLHAGADLGGVGLIGWLATNPPLREEKIKKKKLEKDFEYYGRNKGNPPPLKSPGSAPEMFFPFCENFRPNMK